MRSAWKKSPRYSRVRSICWAASERRSSGNSSTPARRWTSRASRTLGSFTTFCPPGGLDSRRDQLISPMSPPASLPAHRRERVAKMVPPRRMTCVVRGSAVGRGLCFCAAPLIFGRSSRRVLAMSVERDTPLAIVPAPDRDQPGIFELPPAVFDLLAALEGWVDAADLREVPETDALIADLARAGLIEVRG